MHACSCQSKTSRSHFGILIENLSDTEQHTNFWTAKTPRSMNGSAEATLTVVTLEHDNKQNTSYSLVVK